MTNKRVLVSVTDKTGIVEFCGALHELGYEIVSTGGTLRALTDGGVPAVQVSQVTSMPEILGGRVKTLHPTVFAGILARREVAADLGTLREHGIEPIDVVAVNLYPFAQTVANPSATDEEIIEQIDIGGPSLLRAAAKNHRDVYVVVDPADYPSIVEALRSGRGADYGPLRRRLATKVFQHTGQYDTLIHEYFCHGARASAGVVEGVPSAEPSTGPLPLALQLTWPLTQTLRYGENPHQAAAFYADPSEPGPTMATAKQLQGKELSYNNYLDGESAMEMIREFEEPVCVILKHLNPCGAAWGATPLEAYKLALACDPTSAFGGIVGFNRPVDGPLAHELGKLFLEVIIAPEFEEDAFDVFATKKNLRLLETGPLTPRARRLSYKSIAGGILAQERDVMETPRDAMKVVTKAHPDEQDWTGLLFSWKICRWVKSNAIVYADRQRTLGVGAGQMSRVDAANFGLQKAAAAGHSVAGAYMASDAFFPFRDVADLAAKAKVRAIIQPGGSVRDAESIAACDEHGLIMVFTGARHFRH